MAKILVLEGNGILSGVHDLDEIERRTAEGRAKELAATERTACQEETAHQLETVISGWLGSELAEEIAARKLSAATLKQYRESFLRFKQCCAKWDLPHLPASPQAVAVFLTSQLDRGKSHLRRLVKAIGAAHRAADLDDPTEDLLVRAVIRLAREPQQTDKPSEGN